MRYESKLRYAAVLLAAFALGACAEQEDQMDGADDAWVPEPAAPAENRALIVAQFEAGPGAEGQQVNGTAELYRGRLAGGLSAAAAAPAARDENDVVADENAPATDTPRSHASAPGAANAQDGFTVAVRLNGLSDGEHAWHIHSAPCGTHGPVVAPFTETAEEPALDEPLRAQAGGVTADTAFVPASVLAFESIQSTPHSLHVHAQGGVDHGPTVACADLTGEGQSAPALSLDTASPR